MLTGDVDTLLKKKKMKGAYMISYSNLRRDKERLSACKEMCGCLKGTRSKERRKAT